MLAFRHPRGILLRRQPCPSDSQVLPYQVLRGNQPHVPGIRLLRQHIQCDIRAVHEPEDGAVAVSNLFQLRRGHVPDGGAHGDEGPLQPPFRPCKEHDTHNGLQRLVGIPLRRGGLTKPVESCIFNWHEEAEEIPFPDGCPVHREGQRRQADGPVRVHGRRLRHPAVRIWQGHVLCTHGLQHQGSERARDGVRQLEGMGPPPEVSRRF